MVISGILPYKISICIRHRSTDLKKQVENVETAPRVSVPVVKYQQSNQSFPPTFSYKKKKKSNNKKERNWT